MSVTSIVPFYRDLNIHVHTLKINTDRHYHVTGIHYYVMICYITETVYKQTLLHLLHDLLCDYLTLVHWHK